MGLVRGTGLSASRLVGTWALRSREQSRQCFHRGTQLCPRCRISKKSPKALGCHCLGDQEEIRPQMGGEGRPVKTQGDSGHPQAKERGLRRTHPIDALILDF
ncbi:uncharacterized protein LOC125115129 isoform X3 [Phacochoerus africanus]|uniref:uncharacterized protein LOC125115129 isoform X3 n=1 Tax=Phacochoerus africanus TaxID=41426 RepID=UPI001FD8F5CE|nr:uncharacterized protein LOC125115129 isoform X3 [Phacochoerus africanus]